LGSARFIVEDAIVRKPALVDLDRALLCWREAFHRCRELEPTRDELMMAAELEEYGLAQNVDLDVGESILCSIVSSRGLAVLVTGDKRAIEGIERSILDALPASAGVAGRVWCIEQALLHLVGTQGAHAIRKALCSEPGVDRALFVCGECGSEGDIDPSVGLRSYIDDLRVRAPTALADDGALT
jgi:hypothetical protein